MMQQCGVLFCTTNVHGEPRSKYFRKYAYGRCVPDIASALPTRISCGIAAACGERLIVSTPRDQNVRDRWQRPPIRDQASTRRAARPMNRFPRTRARSTCSLRVHGGLTPLRTAGRRPSVHALTLSTGRCPCRDTLWRRSGRGRAAQGDGAARTLERQHRGRFV